MKRFKQFENDDQEFWEEVTGGKEPDPPKDVLDGSARMKLHENMVVQSEIVDRLLEEDFATAEDDADIQHDLEKKLEALALISGLPRRSLRRVVPMRSGRPWFPQHSRSARSLRSSGRKQRNA